MDHDEMVELLDSLENAKLALEGIEHDAAMGRKISDEDKLLFAALKRFVGTWRKISVEVVGKALRK